MQLEQIARSDRSLASHFRRGGGINLNSMDQGLLLRRTRRQTRSLRPIANDY